MILSSHCLLKIFYYEHYCSMILSSCCLLKIFYYEHYYFMILSSCCLLKIFYWEHYFLMILSCCCLLKIFYWEHYFFLLNLYRIFFRIFVALMVKVGIYSLDFNAESERQRSLRTQEIAFPSIQI